MGEALEGGDVGGGEVADVDVVADAGAVGGVVVVAEDAQLGAFADGHLGDVGHQVVGDAVGVLPYPAAGVRADGVEVSQEDDVPFGVGLLDVHEDLFEHALGPAVGVGAGAFGAVFGDGDLGGVAIDGGAGAEDDVLAVVVAHDVDEGEGAADVVFVVFPGFGDALADGFESGEVDAGVEGVVGEEVFEGLAVADVDLVEGDFWHTDELRCAAQGNGVAVAEVVDDHGGVSGVV